MWFWHLMDLTITHFPKKHFWNQNLDEYHHLEKEKNNFQHKNHHKVCFLFIQQLINYHYLCLECHNYEKDIYSDLNWSLSFLCHYFLRWKILTIWDIDSSWNSTASKRYNIQRGEIWPQKFVLLVLLGPREKIKKCFCLFDQQAKFGTHFFIDNRYKA